MEGEGDKGLEAHILTGHEVEGKMGYGCWAIQKEGSNELDKSWVEEINEIITGGNL